MSADGGGGTTRIGRGPSGQESNPAADDVETLAQVVAAHRSGPAAISRLRTRLRQDRNVSAGYLGLGFALLGGLLAVRGLASLGWSWSEGPTRWLTIVAWIALLALFAAIILVARRSGGILPGRFSALVVGVGVVATLLDLAAFVVDRAAGPLYPTAAIGFGACLLASLPLQPVRRGAVGAEALAASGALSVTVGLVLDPQSLPSAVTGVLLGLTPVVAGLLMIHAADVHLGRLIDQALTDSLVAAPAVGHGLAAVSELRRLDDDAERLLAEVSATSTSHPIDPATAARAERLSDELRVALIADHEQTWLQIAVAESEHLARTVRVVDPGALAARLDPDHRRTLLALIWLCVSSATTPVLDLSFLPARDRVHDRVRGTLVGSASSEATIAFSLAGTHRRGIDPAVWPLVARLGRHTVDLGADRALIVVELS